MYTHLDIYVSILERERYTYKYAALCLNARSGGGGSCSAVTALHYDVWLALSPCQVCARLMSVHLQRIWNPTSLQAHPQVVIDSMRMSGIFR